MTTTAPVWEFQLPILTPLSLNDRLHWRVKAEKVAELRQMGWGLAKHHKLPKGMQRIRVTLIYRPRDRRRRDVDNLVATLKPLIDGLVDARIVRDDTPEHIQLDMPRIGEPTKDVRQRFTLRIEQLA